MPQMSIVNEDKVKAAMSNLNPRAKGLTIHETMILKKITQIWGKHEIDAVEGDMKHAK